MCGDGYTSDFEDCDDGNVVNNDGCNSQCQTEPTGYCLGTPWHASLCYLGANMLENFEDTAVSTAAWSTPVLSGGGSSAFNLASSAARFEGTLGLRIVTQDASSKYVTYSERYLVRFPPLFPLASLLLTWTGLCGMSVSVYRSVVGSLSQSFAWHMKPISVARVAEAPIADCSVVVCCAGLQGLLRDKAMFRAMVRINTPNLVGHVPLFLVFTSAYSTLTPQFCLENSCPMRAYTVR